MREEKLTLDEELSLGDESSESLGESSESLDEELTLGTFQEDIELSLDELTLDIATSEAFEESIELTLGAPELVNDSYLDYDSYLFEETNISFLGDEDEEVVGELLTREGLEMSPEESLAKLVAFSEQRLTILVKLFDNEIEDNPDMIRIFQKEVRDVGRAKWLDDHQKYEIVDLVAKYNDDNEVGRLFAQNHTVTRRQKPDLYAYISDIRFEFKKFLEKTNSGSSLRVVTNQVIMREFLASPARAVQAMKGQEACYVSWIRKRKGGTQYCCGNCEHINESKEGFFKILVSERAYASKDHVILFPLDRFCEKCGKLNIVTFAEHQSLGKQLNSEFYESLSNWKRSTRKLTHYGNVMDVEFDKAYYHRLNNHLFKQDDELVVADTKVPEASTDSVYGWYLETLEFVKFLKAGREDYVLEEAPEISKVENLRNLVKIYCNMFGEDYENIRKYSINTILTYLSSNPSLSNQLNPTYVYLEECYSMMKGYLVANDLSLKDKLTIYEYLAVMVGVPFDAEKLDEVEEGLKVQLDKSEYNLKIAKEQYDIALESLDSLAVLFGYLPVEYSNLRDMDEYALMLSDPRVSEWVDKVSLLMIINHLSENIKGYWSTKSQGKAVNILVFKDKIKKTYDADIKALIKAYGREFIVDKSEDVLLRGVKDFLGASFSSPAVFDPVYRMRKAFSSLDYFTFCVSVLDLHKKLEHSSNAFSTLKSLLSVTLEEAKDFLSKHDGALGYYLYHYGNQFSEEEIKAGMKDTAGFSKPLFYIKRTEGETFSEYIKRLSSPSLDDSLKIPDPDAEKFRELGGYIPAVYGAFEYFKFVRTMGAKAKDIVIMNDMVYNSQILGDKFVNRFLAISPLPLDFEDVDIRYDKQKIRIEFILQHLVYQSKDWNFAIRGDDEEVTLEGEILEDLEAAMEQFKHLPEFGEEVYEYYSGRGN